MSSKAVKHENTTVWPVEVIIINDGKSNNKSLLNKNRRFLIIYVKDLSNALLCLLTLLDNLIKTILLK